ncbi:hypothetical protein ACHAWF_004802 [Thalassiosira exigua]
MRCQKGKGQTQRRQSFGEGNEEGELARPPSVSNNMMSVSSSAEPARRVASLEELLARCTVANEQCLSSASACIQAEQIVHVLGLPYPGDATNADLEGLLPLYTRLVKDLRDNADSAFLDILEGAKTSPDAAIVLLYLLEFPHQVRTVRASVSDISECNVGEQFGCADLTEEISKTGSVIKWCRGALSSSGEHHSVVLASCINILDSMNRLPRQKAKKYIKKNVLSVGKNGSKDEIIEQFQLLRSDLADTVLKEDVTRDASANAIIYQSHTLVTLFGSDDDAIEIMKNSPRKDDFEEGLSKHRESFGEHQYQLFRIMLMLEDQSMAEILAGAQVTRSREPLGEFIGCARECCSNPGTKSCNRCKIVRYCSRDCQVVDWKAGHKKVCKKSVHTKAPSEEAVRVARAMASPALRSQDEYLQSNPDIDYRIVLPSGSQDVGVIFPHPMGKSMFKMWRAQAPEAPYVHRMYEMLVENNPGRKDIIRKQLQAEYRVDPLSAEAKRTTGETMPNGQQMADSLSPNMIFYPEEPLKPGNIPSGAAVRGTVGHEVMFTIPLNVYEGRIQKMLTQQSQSGRSLLFGEHAPILLALLDGGIAQGLNETHRAESTTLNANEKLLQSQLVDLKHRIKGGKESFLFIPLEIFYLNVQHSTMKGLISFILRGSTGLADKVMQAYSGVRVWTHKRGPHPRDGSRPPDSDLVGPHEFKAGLRLQCGMTSAIAVVLISMLLKGVFLSSNSETFILPHALVFSSQGRRTSFDSIVKSFGAFTPTFFEDWIKAWCTSGKDCVAPRHDNDIVVKHVGNDHFIERVQREGCSWYPLFSDDPSSSV